jgi:hypothetical protein
VTVLVLDEQLARPGLVVALAERGIEAQRVADFGATGKPDPEVMRRIAEGLGRRKWVLVTMDLTITEDYPGFDWARYAIAWVQVARHLRGVKVEREKANILQRHAHLMIEQQPGDHYTYNARQRFRHPPSLASQLRRPV